MSACAGLALGMIGARRFCGDKAPGGKGAGRKGPPACSALTFRAVASGASDGEQQAGYYRSRYGTLALHADVKQGQPTDYFVLADGKRLAAAPAAPARLGGELCRGEEIAKAGRRRGLAVHRPALQGRPRP